MVGELGDDGWVRVEWGNGTTNSYRMGIEGKYDLTLACPPSPVTTESETEEPSEKGGVFNVDWAKNQKQGHILILNPIFLSRISTCQRQSTDKTNKNFKHELFT